MGLKLINISKKYDNIQAVDNVSLEVTKGELLALLGPSGCGKTTLLRIVAGLIDQNSGTILINDRDISSWAAQRRNTAMVFQSYALFPHLDVKENIAYGLKTRKLPVAHINEKVNRVTEITELAGLLDRQVHELSGGQQQRVALARALVLEPDVLLFDEPLSNLDEKLRVTMRQEIKRIQSELGITSIYVTHDQEEALAIADTIAVMNNGIIEQLGTPDQIYHQPTNAFVADFIGRANLLQAKVLQKGTGFVQVELLNREVVFEVIEIDKAEHVTCLLRPEEIIIGSDGDLSATIVWKENLGNIKRYTVKLTEGTQLTVDVLNNKHTRSYNIGDRVGIAFDKDAIQFIEGV